MKVSDYRRIMARGYINKAAECFKPVRLFLRQIDTDDSGEEEIMAAARICVGHLEDTKSELLELRYKLERFLR